MTLYGKVKKQKFLAWESNNAAGEPTYLHTAMPRYLQQATCKHMSLFDKPEKGAHHLNYHKMGSCNNYPQSLRAQNIYVDICHHIKCSDY